MTQQDQSIPAPKTPVTITLPDSSNLVQLQQILQFSYNYLSKSSAPANQVEDVKTVIQQLFPLLVPVKEDTTVEEAPTIDQ